MPSWIQDPETGELIPKEKYYRDSSQSHYVQVMQDFVSPIDGSVIGDAKQLAAHNRRHGVTNIRDYGENYFGRKAREREHTLRGDTPAAKKDRINNIIQSIEKHTRG